jgi:hypothetical protein
MTLTCRVISEQHVTYSEAAFSSVADLDLDGPL